MGKADVLTLTLMKLIEIDVMSVFAGHFLTGWISVDLSWEPLK